jgi:hypothetical protein
MTIAATRTLWRTLEPLHAVLYFAPGLRDTGAALGLKGYWMAYFAFRAAPMGLVDAAVVDATFSNFSPTLVARAVPEVWQRTTPEAAIEARLQVATDTMRAIGVDAAACAEAAAVLAPIAAAADATGRPLFAGNARLPLPVDPLGALWQLAGTLREHRGDGHIAAMVAGGLSGLEANVLQVAAGRGEAAAMQTARGWSPEQWQAAAEGLTERGLLDGESLTEAGRARLAEIEDRTDSAAWDGGLARLGERAIDDLAQLLAPSLAAVTESGLLPPVGMVSARDQ